jgi:23S rRNA pseudouridine1911/1915/1917 synthase
MMDERREIVIGEQQAGATVSAVVRELYAIPWSKARGLCESGRVRVDGAAVRDPAARVKAGARVEVDPTAPKRTKGVLSRESILHVDADVIVVSKPAGVLTLPYDETDRDTLADRTRAALRRMDRRRRDPMVGVVQRLDKDTTGVLVFARHMSAKRALEAQLREHSVTRRYLAIAHGEVRDMRRETFIVQDRGDGLRGSWGTMPFHRGPPPRDAKRAVTHVRRRERLSGATLVECRLETGRQHQIRIHLSESGHPLVGEPVYVRDFPGPRIAAPRPMLHATELAFDHPRTGERVRFEEPPPDDFEEMRRALATRARD